jgi:hypothetical protein
MIDLIILKYKTLVGRVFHCGVPPPENVLGVLNYDLHIIKLVG